MSVLNQINEVMGVEPADIRKRLVIGSTAVVVVTVLNIIVLLAWAGIFGVVNFFGITLIPVENIDKVAQFILVMSGLFVASIVYFIILPGKKESERKHYEGQYIWTLEK